MRALEVLGLAGDGTHVVCQDPSSGEEFRIAADERLAAAARGDLSRLGQLEIEMESQLRPKEIQARIRSGATVAEVAKAAGTDAARIERFAYPVLMERSSVADQAARATVEGRHDGAPVREVVAERLSALGHGGEVRWDAHRAPAGWMLTAHWSIGRTENVAAFLLHPRPGGGVVEEANDTATELLSPQRSPLRTVGYATGAKDGRSVPAQKVPAAVVPAAVPGPVVTVPPAVAPDLDETQRIPRLDAAGAIAAAGATPPRRPVPRPVPIAAATRPAASAQTAAHDTDPAELTDQEKLVVDTVVDERAGAHGTAAPEQVARTGTDHSSSRSGGRTGRSGKPGKPSMPSWDDVLLGSGVRKR